MKRQWTADELAEHWTLYPADEALLANKAAATRLGCALLLKYFQIDGRFPPRKGDVPPAAIVHVAQQLDVTPELYAQYDWGGRTVESHRAQIRQALGFREATAQDADDLAAWLGRDVLPHEHRPEQLQAAVFARCRSGRIEPPAPGRIDRLIRSALRAYEDRLYQGVLARLGPEGLARIDALLAPSEAGDAGAADQDRGQGRPGARDPGRLTLQDLKADSGHISLDNVLAQIDKLRRVRQVALPHDLFAGVE